MVKHLLLDIGDDEPAVGAQLRCHVQGLQAGAWADLEYLLAGRGCSSASRRRRVSRGSGMSSR